MGGSAVVNRIARKSKRATSSMMAVCCVIGGIASAPSAAAIDDVVRLEAADAAKNFYDTAALPFFGANCTFFVSQALWDGGMASTPDWTPDSSDDSKLASSLLDPGPTRAAASADHFKNYMVNSGRASIKEIRWSDNTVGGAELADIIAYDWEGPADGIVDHLAMVTSFDGTYPLVTQQAPARLNRGWSWDPGAEQWIEFSHPGSRVYLIHIL